MKIKRLIVGLMLLALIPFNVFSIHVSDKNWGKVDNRSIPSIPTLSQDDNAIYIYSDKELDNLCIEIKDLSGEIVYSTVATVAAGTEYPTSITSLPEGDYLFVITQGRKYIVGNFTK